MVLDTEIRNRYFAVWQTSFGGLVCLCCVVFLGLKFKWFRAQLNLGEPSKKNSGAPVQGVGFKMRSNPDDFQAYRVISEFAPVSEVQKEIAKPISKPIAKEKQNGTNIQNKPKAPPKALPNAAPKALPNAAPKAPPVAEPKGAPKTAQKAPPKAAPVAPPRAPEFKPILKPQITKAREHKNSVNFDEEVTEISNPNEKTFSELINQQTTEKNEYEQLTKINQQSLQIKNPLASKTVINNPKKPKSQPIQPIQTIQPIQRKEPEPAEYFANTHSSMYSSTAASIFFGGPPATQPRARKFEEMDDDVISVVSQTSA